MIDFINIRYDEKEILENFIIDNRKLFPELRATIELRENIREYPLKTKLKNLEIRVTENTGIVKNSIHKLNNLRQLGLDRNHNDFTYSQLIENIEFLEAKLIGIENTKLTNIEFGFNIEVDNSAESIIRDHILMHQFNSYSSNERFGGKGELKRFEHSNYTIKLYDKAKQYSIIQNIFRFEIKHKRSRSFNKYGIYSILDLKDKDKLNRLFQNLLKRFDEMIIVDSYCERDIPNKDKSKLNSYLNYMYWQSLHRKDRNKKVRTKQELNKILHQYNLLTIKRKLREKLNSKFEYLINN